jgi:hypothetical protein
VFPQHHQYSFPFSSVPRLALPTFDQLHVLFALTLAGGHFEKSPSQFLDILHEA